MRVELTGGDGVSIDVELQDPILAEVLAREESEDDRAYRVADMLEIGARVLVRHQDGEQVDVIRSEMSKLTDLVERAQQDLVKETTGDFTQAMKEVINGVGEHLASISGRLDGVLLGAAKDAELAAERDRGTAKGRTFEQLVYEEIDSIARHQGDECVHVGDTGGAGGRAGDVLVRLGGAQGPSLGTIVFEAKASKLSQPEAMRELDRAIKTRGADFGVLIVDGEERLPSSTHQLREYGGDKIVVARLDEDWNQVGIEFAYSLARARILQRRVEVEGADVAGALAHLERAEQALASARSLKLKMTAIQTAAEEGKQVVDAMANEVRIAVAAARACLDRS